MMEEDAVERPSETWVMGGFFVGALVGAYAMWAGPVAALVVVASGAVGAVGARKPDLVILDVMLPGRSGYDILRDLRAAEATADLPVLMLTARGQTKDREMAETLGASRFMAKPFSNAEVLEAVRDLVRP